MTHMLEKQRLEVMIACASACRCFDPKDIKTNSLLALAGACETVRRTCKLVVPLRVHMTMCTMFSSSLFAQERWVELAQSLRVWIAEGLH